MIFEYIISKNFFFSVDCKWSKWSNCSKSCGGGFQTRFIEVQAENGGRLCTGQLKKRCYLKECPSKLIES